MAGLQAAELQRIGTEVALKGRQESGPVTELTELERNARAASDPDDIELSL